MHIHTHIVHVWTIYCARVCIQNVPSCSGHLKHRELSSNKFVHVSFRSFTGSQLLQSRAQGRQGRLFVSFCHANAVALRPFLTSGRLACCEMVHGVLLDACHFPADVQEVWEYEALRLVCEGLQKYQTLTSTVGGMDEVVKKGIVVLSIFRWMYIYKYCTHTWIPYYRIGEIFARLNFRVFRDLIQFAKLYLRNR